MNTFNNPRQALIKALCRISSPKDMASVLEGLLTQKELQELDNRLRIFEGLDKNIPQREIASTLGVGIATVTRGAQAFKNGHFKVLKRHLGSS